MKIKTYITFNSTVQHTQREVKFLHFSNHITAIKKKYWGNFYLKREEERTAIPDVESSRSTYEESDVHTMVSHRGHNCIFDASRSYADASPS